MWSVLKRSVASTPRALLTLAASFLVVHGGAGGAAAGGPTPTSQPRQAPQPTTTRWNVRATTSFCSIVISDQRAPGGQLDPNDPWVSKLKKEFRCDCCYCQETGANPALRRADQWDTLKTLLNYKSQASIGAGTSAIKAVASSGASSKIEVVNDVEKRLSRSRLCEDVAEAVGASREPWSPTAGLPNVRTAVITRARSRISVDMLEPDFCFQAPEDFRTLHCDGRFVPSVPSKLVQSSLNTAQSVWRFAKSLFFASSGEEPAICTPAAAEPAVPTISGIQHPSVVKLDERTPLNTQQPSTRARKTTEYSTTRLMFSGDSVIDFRSDVRYGSMGSFTSMFASSDESSENSSKAACKKQRSRSCPISKDRGQSGVRLAGAGRRSSSVDLGARSVSSLEPIVEEAEDPSPSDKQIVIQGFHSKHGVEISELIDESNLTSPDVFEEEAQDQTKATVSSTPSVVTSKRSSLVVRLKFKCAPGSEGKFTEATFLSAGQDASAAASDPEASGADRSTSSDKGQPKVTVKKTGRDLIEIGIELTPTSTAKFSLSEVVLEKTGKEIRKCTITDVAAPVSGSSERPRVPPRSGILKNRSGTNSPSSSDSEPAGGKRVGFRDFVNNRNGNDVSDKFWNRRAALSEEPALLKENGELNIPVFPSPRKEKAALSVPSVSKLTSIPRREKRQQLLTDYFGPGKRPSESKAAADSNRTTPVAQERSTPGQRPSRDRYLLRSLKPTGNLPRTKASTSLLGLANRNSLI